MDVMRAFHVPAPGQPTRLSELPVPEIAEGTVLVRVRAAGLNPIDKLIAAGMLAGLLPHEYPLVLGRDAAGVVEAIGAGVEHVRVGDEVLGHILLAPPLRHGTLAEYAPLPAAAVVLKPAGLDFVRAAALPLAAATGVAAVDAIEPRPGLVVLVNGAGGGVGSFAVQLLAARGATIVATGSATSRDRLLALGARTVVDYTVGSVVEQVRAAFPAGVDALMNLAGYSAADVPLGAVRTGGTVATTTEAPDDHALAAAGLVGGAVNGRPVRQVLAPLAEQAAAGRLKVHVATMVPLDRAADGLAVIAAGQAHGKIVVTIGS
jgi:NADPH:quinone reductase-like Zn-dependent oxidoreductase